MKTRLRNILKWFVSVPPYLAAPGLRPLGGRLLWLLPILLPFLLAHIWSGSAHDFHFMAWHNDPFSLLRLWNSALEHICWLPIGASIYFFPYLSLTLILGCCWWRWPRPLLYLAFLWAAFWVCQHILLSTWDWYRETLKEFPSYKAAVPAWFLNFPLGHR